MIKRVLCLFLLLVWGFQNYYPFAWYQIQRHACWENFEESKHDVLPENLRTISFSKNSHIHWEKINKEFELEGTMYDVVSIQYTDSLTVISCISDADETASFYAYLKTFKRNQKERSKSKSKKINFFTEDFPRFTFNRVSQNFQVSKQTNNLRSVFQEVEQLPPKLLFYCG